MPAWHTVPAAPAVKVEVVVQSLLVTQGPQVPAVPAALPAVEHTGAPVDATH